MEKYIASLSKRESADFTGRVLSLIGGETRGEVGSSDPAYQNASK